MAITSTPGAEGDHVQVTTTHKPFEPIQYTYKTYQKTSFEAKLESTTDEYEDEDVNEEDKHASKRLQTNGLFVPSNGFFTWAHKVQAPTSENAAEEQAASISSMANGSLDQEAQATNPSHGSRVPRLLLTTLLPQQLIKSLVILELPLELDANHMNAVYTMISVPVPDSLSFKARYASLLQHFVKIHLRPEQKAEPTIAVLTPVTNCTVKMITLAEKLKRDLESCAIKCFQYCAAQSRKVLLDHVKSVKRNRKGDTANRDATADSVASVAIGLDGRASNENDEEEEEAFQTMGLPHENSPRVAASGDRKLRHVPVMTIFLALASVPELRQRYWLDSLVVYLDRGHLTDNLRSEQTN